MKTASTTLVAALLAVTEAQVLLWDISKQHVDNNGVLRRADKTVEEIIKNDKTQGGYFADVTIGNPPQTFSLQLDTGSSDIWVPYVGSSGCKTKKGCQHGSFDPKKSSSFRDLGADTFKIGYADNSGASGNYFQDELTIACAKVSNLTMGLALKTDIAYGLIGVGYANNEASIQTIRKIYPNLPVAMQQQGVINTIAYSLWLNSLDSDTGNILFGGIDTEKFQGKMSIIDILKDERANNYTHFSVPLTTVEVADTSKTTLSTREKGPIEAVLDSGTTLTYLPDDMAKQAWKAVGAVWQNELQLPVLPCSRRTSKGTVNFQFAGNNGPKIEVPMSELVITAGTTRKGESVCAFGIVNQTLSDDIPYLLGDTMLRSAYVVYDLVNNQIGIAPTKFNVTKSNILPFMSKGGSILDTLAGKTNGTKLAIRAASGTCEPAKGGNNKDTTGSGATTSVVLSGSAVLTVLASMTYMLFL